MNTIHTTYKNADLNFTIISSHELTVTAEISNNNFITFSIDFFIQDLKTDNDDRSYWRVQVDHINDYGDYCVEEVIRDLFVNSWEYDSDNLIDCVNALITKTFKIEQQAEDKAKACRKYIHK